MSFVSSPCRDRDGSVAVLVPTRFLESGPKLTYVHSTAGSASIEVSAADGGRLASLTVDGHQLLVIGTESGALQWGAYPMVPWAGRIRNGRFSFDGQDVLLPLNLPPHSAHGVGFTSTWDVVDERTIRCSLDDPWPFGGTAVQRFDLDPAGLTTTITVVATETMPVMVGWHPWFTKTLEAADGSAVHAELHFGPAAMYELDDEAIPTGRLVGQPEGPWDNCFTALPANPRISWPGELSVELSSSCDHWVIYNQPEHALCVEPQSAAPDVFHRDPQILKAGEELSAWYRIAWD